MKKYLGVLVVGLLIIGVYRALRAPGFITTSVTVGPAVSAVYATGTVEPTVMIPIAPRLMGRIVELNLDEGATVQAGQQLARLEDRDLQSAGEELRVRRDNAARELDRARKLIETQALSRSEFDKVRADYDAASAAYRRAEVEAGFMILKAPEAGRIIKRDGEVGELIPANQPIFWLSGSEPLRITAEVDEEDIVDLKVGNRVVIRADAFGDQTFEGVVNSITEKGDPISRSFRVRIGLAADSPLRIGMTVETNVILAEKKDALLAPTSAITPRATVWLVRDGRVEERGVQLGIRGVEKSEILDGVAVGDEVVVTPTTDLKQGMRIRSLGAK